MPEDTSLWPEYDFYQLLGVPKNAPSEVIKAAIKQKLLEWHPDRQRGQSPEVYDTFTNLTKAVNAAKEALLDPNSRARYDRFREKHAPRNQSQYSNSGDGQHHQRESWSEYSRRYRTRSNNGNDRRHQRENQHGYDHQSHGHEEERRNHDHRERSGSNGNNREHQRENWSGTNRGSHGHEEERSGDQYRTRPTSHDRTSGRSATTFGYIILALLALAAAGGLTYGFIQALPAIIDFLGTLFTWVIALGFWIVIIALVLKSYSRN